jgi:hypothetical protein
VCAEVRDVWPHSLFSSEHASTSSPPHHVPLARLTVLLLTDANMAPVWTAVALAVLVAVAQSAIPADQITSLPGWNGPLPSTQYSGMCVLFGGCVWVWGNIGTAWCAGYLPVPDGFLHYWFVTSQNDPTTVRVS